MSCLAESPRTGFGIQLDDPIVVLTYARSGVARLHALLDAHPAVACFSGAGLAPLCSRAIDVWQQVEARSATGPSRLAMSATRSMINTMVSMRLMERGKPRWCDTTPGGADAASRFLDLYPKAKFICLHRRCADMISATISASPWNLMGYGIEPFAAAHPGNHVATLADYWASHTEAILAVEINHKDRCHRIRYEDLAAVQGKAADDMFAFLGLDPPAAIHVGGAEQSPRLPVMDESDVNARGQDVPTGSIQPRLLARVNELHARLGYPQLAANAD
jgi:protein-tyrosine sulfotransferase